MMIRDDYAKVGVPMLPVVADDEPNARQIFWDTPPEELLSAIRAVHTGQKRISPEVAAKLTNRMSSPELTCREMEVLRLVVTRLSNKEIGTTLYIGEGTVRAHINNILSKMGASDRTQAATLAIKRGLIRLE